MTRPRVPENKRQRTARACDSCKRRKQKCNGLNPCNTCVKRSLVCEYTDDRSPPKRQGSATTRRRRQHAIEARVSASTTPSTEPMRPPGTSSMSSAVMSLDSNDGFFFLCRDTPTSDASSHSIVSEDDDEEFEVVRQCRMLEDSSNRLFYLGDSSSFSFVQLMRMIVDNAAGPSPFTVDPHRHKMLDMPSPSSHAPTTPYVLLPDRQTANLLVRSFFVNTHGIVELFDRRSFTGYLDACYSHPLSVDSSALCSVYLVLAVGLAMAAPAPGSLDDLLFRRLQGEQPSRAEALFRAAKTLADPMNGANEADLWVIQVWTLMTLYLMITAKTTAAYSYCGMAIRSACALGLHRTRDTMSLFSNVRGHLTLRRDIWRSLFVLDRFLAASLGRPVAICDDDDEEVILPKGSPSEDDEDDGDSLASTAKGARSMGHIVRGLYGSKSTLSTRQAQEIVDKCNLWSMKPAHQSLSSEAVFAGRVSAERGIAILHAYLMHYHAIMLLTRPFFVHLLVRAQTKSEYRVFSSVEKFSQACVAASTKSISLIRAVYDAGQLPRRNPFILYFLFSSAVVVLSNEFSRLYQNAEYDTCMASVLAVLEHCGETDVQAPRMLYIIQTFQAAVEAHGHGKTYAPHHPGSERDPVPPRRSSQQYDIGGGETGGELHVTLKQEPEDDGGPACQW